MTLFGENRDQEASAKARELASYCEQRAVQPPHWAFIGQLQTNKAKSVVKYASSVHSVDRPSLADALAKAYANQLARYEAGEAPAPAALENGPDVAFENLYGLAARLREHLPHATEISAGMSGDLEAAVRWGSTCVRVGSDIMGRRPAR